MAKIRMTRQRRMLRASPSGECDEDDGRGVLSKRQPRLQTPEAQNDAAETQKSSNQCRNQ